MKLTWLGHACFLLEEDGYRIVLDPYTGVAGYPPLHIQAHAVFCSHGHFDHHATDCVELLPERESPFTVREVETFHDDRGGALLVAAAAGSGKTKVLVDRLMGYLTDPTNPADLDDFLIITYTRAAASELRGKIAARIADALAVAPDDRHLQRQLTRVYLAQISTVHSFCQTVLRQYAAEADLPADFRVADEQQAAALRAQTLRDVLSELYAQLDDEPDFASMIDTLGYGRDDRRLLDLAERSYDVMRCKVDPAAWMADCLHAYALPEGIAAEQTLWGAYYICLLYTSPSPRD